MTDEMPVPTHSTNQVDPLAERYRAAFDKTRQGRAQWIEGTLELAEVVLQARREYADHGAFSVWLDRQGLQKMSKDDRWALINMAEADQAAMRQELERSDSISWERIWRKSPQRALRTNPKGTPAPISRRSGSALRRRARRIPDVMQDQPPRPQPAAVRLKGLTREEVDPDFKGTDLQFAAKYQHVNLHTKDEIERSRRQDVLQKWLGTGTAFGAATPPDQATLAEWAAKPGRTARVSDLQAALRQAVDLLQTVCPKPKEQIATSSDLLSDECPDRHSLND